MTITTAFSVTIPKVIQCITFDTRTATVVSLITQTVNVCPGGGGGGEHNGMSKNCVMMAWKKIPCPTETCVDEMFLRRHEDPCETGLIERPYPVIPPCITTEILPTRIARERM